MAQYKVLQDIEAEDKLLGPLSLRQFIYAAITVAIGFVAFRLFVSSAWILGFFFVPPALFFGLLAAPLGGQQSSEIWLLAKIRFFLKPRKRIWDQSGIEELVTITAPKKVEKQLTKGYTSDEVKSRLQTLSSTLDTRGWAIKNATANMYVATGENTDRLLSVEAQSAPAAVVEPTADILDPSVNPRAQAMEQMMQKSAAQHKDLIQQNIKKQQEAQQISKEDEQKLLDKIHREKSQEHLRDSHQKTIPAPMHNNTQNNPESTVTQQPNPDILNLVKNSDGLSVQSTANLANRKKDSDDEVVISLH